jgi:biopolymer transport protein ExbB/TolQ
MEETTMAALGIAIATLVLVRSLYAQVRSLRTRLDELENELDEQVLGRESH